MTLRSPALVVLVLAGLLAPGLHATSAQPAFQVADVNTSRTGSVAQWPYRGEFVRLGSQVLFTADDGIHGYEAWITDGTAAGTRLLADACPGVCSSAPLGLTAAGSRVFFSADDGAHGKELWITDGTTAGTALVADLVPGLESSRPLYLAPFGGSVVFAAIDPVHGNELWISDGTAAGTLRLTDLSPAQSYAIPVPWTQMGGRLFFLAEDAGSGKELWTTDGTPGGTHLLKDILPGTESSMHDIQDPYPGALPFVASGGQLFFAADDGVNGTELWTSDGTSAGTLLLADLYPGLGSSTPRDLIALAGTVYFSAEGAGLGRELWKSDGTAAGSIVVKDIRLSGSNGSEPRELTPVGNTLFFRAFEDDHGNELWKSDGTEAGTVLVKDVRPGPPSGAFFFGITLTALDGRLAFYADDGVEGPEPWASDGTAAGTVPLGDLNPGPLGSLFLGGAASDLRAVAGGHWYFQAFTTVEPPTLEVWTTDGTPAGTHILKTVNAVTSAVEPFPAAQVRTPEPMASLGGNVIFQASDGIASDLWKTDGTAAGTVPLADAYAGPESGLPQELTALGGTVLFQATDEDHGGELWSTDGTAAGTGLLVDLPNPQGTPGSFPAELTRLDGRVFFRAGDRLWKSDGTAPGTLALDGTANAFTGPYGLERLGGAILFAATSNDGEELWRSDGTQAGTLRVKDIAPGLSSSAPNQITSIGGLSLFSAITAATGRELWKTDGTGTGTVLVKDVRPGPGDSMRQTWDSPAQPEDRFAAVGGTVFFPADDGTAGEELWKSDGSAAGTVLVKDVFPGPRSSEIRWLAAAGGRVFFVADDGVHGRELWVSDGTPAGTRLVADLVAGPKSAVPQELAALGHVLLFSATDGAGGRELWRSNGTAEGTRQVQDIAPGPLPSSPFSFTSLGASVYFFANDGTAGFELWAAPQAPLLATYTDVPTTYWAWRFVEAAAAAGVTSGCGSGLYCPGLATNRAEMAIFLVRGIHGSGFVPPPATGTRFQDVPASHPAAPWIEQLAADGITAGCSSQPPLYCPAAGLSRAEMAVFLLLGRHGAGYTPPPATGTRFQDVPLGYWAAPWIEQLAAEGITSGCSPTSFCPGQPLNRAEITVFLGVAFNLPLP
jgi:ELWxxDGT repeat protein